MTLVNCLMKYCLRLGALGFILEQQPNVVNTIGNSAGLILAFMVDSLLVCHRIDFDMTCFYNFRLDLPMLCRLE